MSTPTAAGLADPALAVLFAGTQPSEQPMLTLVVGSPGAGKSRTISHSAVRLETEATVISADDLGAFHPDFLELTRRRPLEAPGALSATVADLLGRSLNHARITKRSLILDATINTPAAAIATAASFETAGFATRIVVVAARRSHSLLTTASRYLNARRLGAPARFVDSQTHRRGWVGTTDLVRAVEASKPVEQVTIISRDGTIAFDADRSQGFGGATTAYESVQQAEVTTLEGARWFGELRRITEFAREARELSPPVAEVLVELHELALNEVLPAMAVRRQSAFVVAQEARLTAELVALRREIPREVPSVDIAAPIYAPQGPRPTGPSL